ncbi:MAG: carbohydrate kinase family protein [Butyrivibrio sp.]|nr:carbohydrate kinase family protein [Butyrivibrio sp.]
MAKKVTVIGAAIVDVLAGPIGNKLMDTGSMPMENIIMTYGGNGHNEAVTLSRLGVETSLVTKLGNDETGKRVLSHLKEEQVGTDFVVIEDNLVTGINVVLYDHEGERRFLTNPAGSLRRLSKEDVLRKADDFDDIVSFSDLFASPLIDLNAAEMIFKKIKEKPSRILAVDMVKPKKSEKIRDMEKLFKYIDFFLPNEEELKLLSDMEEPEAAKQILALGAGNVIVKKGKNGCDIWNKNGCTNIPSCKVARVVDTTGAGDTFVAGFLYGLSNGISIEDCAQQGCITASKCVQHVGATDNQ